MKEIVLGDIRAEVVLKDIKNVHLSVYPPSGRVRIAAPLRMDMETIRIFTLSKLGWIKKQQKKFREQEREKTREYVNRESHYFLGKRYLLYVQKGKSPATIEIKGNRMNMTVHSRPMSPSTPSREIPDSVKVRKQILDTWYRAQLKKVVFEMVAKWEKQMNVKVTTMGVRKMKTMWGSCNPEQSKILVNLELAKKPIECIEYIVVHEMVHLLERRHNDRFMAYLDKFLPHWREVKKELNKLPVRHDEWNY